MTVYDALLRAIESNPDEDTPRLVLADYFENPDEGNDPVLAELIRVQVELARTPLCGGGDIINKNHCDNCLLVYSLRIRESALLREHSARWRRGEKCERCGGNSWRRKSDTHRGRDCPTCHGTGWERWWLSELKGGVPWDKTKPWPWQHPVHFERGLIVQVDANLADIFQDDSPTPWALAVVRGEPCGRRFGVVDKVPENDRGWMWFVGDDDSCFGPDAQSTIPRFLWNQLPGMELMDWGEEYKGFDSPAAANRAVGEAAWAEVKKQLSGESHG